MKRVVVALFLFIFPVALFAAGPTRPVIVGLKAHIGRLAVKSLSTSFDPSDPARNYHEFNIVRAFAANLSEDEIAELKKSSDVTYVEDDVERHAFSAGLQSAALEPSAETASAQIIPYGVNLVHAPQAWVGGRGATINVVVIDTGVDYHHPELSGIFAGGTNFVAGTDDPMDDNGHGTHCSGIIAAADNAIGVVGVAPQVRLWAVKVLDANGSGKNSNVVKGLDWVVQKKNELGGDWVASLSLGGCQSTVTDRNAFTNTVAAGVLVVAAAGNHDPSKPDICSNDDSSNSYKVSFPAAYPGVVAVAAVDSASQVATFSNIGAEVLLSAPGVDVFSTFPVGTGDTFGTVTPDAGTPLRSLPLEDSPLTEFSGPYVYCGKGVVASDFPASVKGKIALIQRGDATFATKATNAKTAGATGVVIFNNGADLFHGTLNDPTVNWLPSVAISTADGQDLVDHHKASLSIAFGTAPDDYAFESGTSMACPHVAGAAAAVWSMAPGATAAQVTQALVSTAHDLGAAGFDTLYGNGLTDVEAAGKQLNPAAFIPPPPPHQTGRLPGRRGH